MAELHNLSDLHLGDQMVTLKKLESDFLDSTSQPNIQLLRRKPFCWSLSTSSVGRPAGK